MKLKLNNIGNFTNTEVELKKITVFAGENSTGKSTILNSIDLLTSINSDEFMLFLEHYYKKELTSKIYEWFGLYNYSNIDFDAMDFEDSLFESKNEDVLETEQIINVSMRKILKLVHVFNFSGGLVVFKVLIEYLKSKITNVSFFQLNNEMDDIIKTYFNEDVIESSFLDFLNKDRVVKRGNSTRNAISVKRGETYGSLSLEKGENKISITLSDNGKSNPYSYDNIKSFKLKSLWDKPSFSMNGISSNKGFFLKDKDSFESISKDKNIKDIVERINAILGENVAGLPSSNFSSGMLAFDTLRKIRFSLFKNGGFLILDGVESTLDPENQLKFAELLVMLVKNTNINVVISSHSGYFLEAIELYTRLENMNDDINFYLTSKEDKTFKVENVNDDLGKLYLHFLSPYEKFDTLRQEINKKDKH